jgi:hypothetical protein
MDTKKMRQMARGGQYTPKMIREALRQAADALDAAQSGITDRDNLTNNLAITMAAMVDASGGRFRA